MSSRDVILTTVHRVGVAYADTFLASLRRTGYDGKVVFFASALEAVVLERLRQDGVIVVPFQFRSKHVKQRLARLWPLCRLLFASRLPLAFKERLAHAVFHLFYRRHLLYLDYLRQHRQEYDRVFLTDCRDVFFQADPFAWNPAPGVHFFLEEETNKIGQCRHHIGWITSQFGQAVFERMRHHTVACAGTTFGDTAAIMEYLSQMVEATMQVLSLAEVAGDQGVHNYLLREDRLPNVTIHENRRGPVMTTGPMSAGNIRFSEQGLVVNDAGQVVNVLHQYDRHPELKRILLGQLRAVPPVK